MSRVTTSFSGAQWPPDATAAHLLHASNSIAPLSGCSLYCSTCIFVAVSPHLTSRFFITLHSLCPHTPLPDVLCSVPALRTLKSQRPSSNLSFLVLLGMPEPGDGARTSVINKRRRKDADRPGKEREVKTACWQNNTFI